MNFNFNEICKDIDNHLNEPIEDGDNKKDGIKDKLEKVTMSISSSALEENENRKIEEINLVIRYHNPLAYGYPEVVRWEEKYKMELKKERIK